MEHQLQKTPALIALNIWLTQLGITPVTAWRWRQKGWLRTTNIMGRLYISQSALDEFNRRAEAGEFAKEHRCPKKATLEARSE